MLTISLLHATYRSQSGPLHHRDLWLSRAQSPERLNYVVSMDDNDVSAIAQTEGIERAVNRPRDTYSTAVQNWNAAATLATGDLLFVISDDLEPEVGWDAKLEHLIQDWNPLTQDFALKIQDSPNPNDTTLRHPIISRRFYARFGLFDESFRGVFCDNDITLRALLYSRIEDGRSLHFKHTHPHFERKTEATASHHKINRPEEYAFGRQAFEKKYAPFHRGLSLNSLTLPVGMPNIGVSIGFRKIGIALKAMLSGTQHLRR